MKRARLIYNPTSGQEIIKKHIAGILDLLESYGYEASAFATTAEPDSAQNEAARCAATGFSLLVIAGGDGTINEAVNGLMTLEKAQRPMVAIIPTGTTNDFARALKIPRNKPIEAVKIIAQQQLMAIDVGRINQEQYFINIAAGGALTELTYSVPSTAKTAFGYLAYITKGAELLPQVRKAPVRIVHDGEVLEADISMFFCALTNSVGGFENIAPDAKLDDGNFTLILVKTDNFFDLIALLGMVASGSGRHVDDVNISYIKAKSVEIVPLDTKRWLVNLDGEYGGRAPVRFDNIQGALDIFTNLDSVPSLADGADDDDDERAVESIAHKFAEEAGQLREGK